MSPGSIQNNSSSSFQKNPRITENRTKLSTLLHTHKVRHWNFLIFPLFLFDTLCLFLRCLADFSIRLNIHTVYKVKILARTCHPAVALGQVLASNAAVVLGRAAGAHDMRLFRAHPLRATQIVPLLLAIWVPNIIFFAGGPLCLVLWRWRAFCSKP